MHYRIIILVKLILALFILFMSVEVYSASWHSIKPVDQCILCTEVFNAVKIYLNKGGGDI